MRVLVSDGLPSPKGTVGLQIVNIIVPVNALDGRQCVAEQLGHLVRILAVHKHVRRAAVPQHVRVCLDAKRCRELDEFASRSAGGIFL